MGAACARSGLKPWAIPQGELAQLHPESLPGTVLLTGTDVGFIRQAMALLKASGRRAVLAGLDAEQFGEDISCAAPSRRAETQQLVNYLCACGRQHIALVGFGVNSIHDMFRYHAAMSAIAARGLSITQRDAWLWHHDPAASFRAFLPCARQYDGVICPNDVIAICFITCCRQAGISVPEALYVASFGNTRIGQLYTPSLTTMTMDMAHVGEQPFTVWQFLQSDLSGQAMFKITVPSRILVRASTGGQLPHPLPLPMPPAGDDRYYMNPLVAPLEAIEKCLSQRDALDLRILSALLAGDSYEAVCARLYISASSLRYRLNKIFASLEVKTRAGLEELLRGQLGSRNPFCSAEPDARG